MTNADQAAERISTQLYPGADPDKLIAVLRRDVAAVLADREPLLDAVAKLGATVNMNAAIAEEANAEADQLRAEVGRLTRERDEARAETDRLWYFINANDRFHDVITGRPDHYIVNGDHSGCNCGTDWKPPHVRAEWSAQTDSIGLPPLPEASARQWAERPGYRLVRRLVTEWTAAAATDSPRVAQETTAAGIGDET